MAARAPRDVVVRLNNRDEMFSADATSVFGPGGRLMSGIEEVVQYLLAVKKIDPRQRIVVVLPEGEVHTHTEAEMDGALRRYCRLRILQDSRNLRVIWRDGVTSLRSGTILFLIGLLLSYIFTRDDIPDLLRNLLGDGVFLVILWVGLWYPLDLLFFAREPVRRELRVLTELQQMPLVVRSEDPH